MYPGQLLPMKEEALETWLCCASVLHCHSVRMQRQLRLTGSGLECLPNMCVRPWVQFLRKRLEIARYNGLYVDSLTIQEV